MESVESPLEVLSRAATMVQHSRPYSSSDDADSEAPTAGSECAPESAPAPPEGAAPPKQLPSSKWRRDRRSTTRIPDYKHREPGLLGSKASRSQSFNDKSSCKRPPSRLRQDGQHHSEGDLVHDSDGAFTWENGSPNLPKENCKGGEYVECPLDMSLKEVARSSPPSYQQTISSGLLFRPSVIITHAPTAPLAPLPPPPLKDIGKGEYVPGSMSMCDPVIDEHFRRSLGADYMTLFSKTKEASGVTNGKSTKAVTKDRGSSPIMFASDPCTKFLHGNSKSPKEEDSSHSETAEEEDVSMEVEDSTGPSVDDHFAKALGETWKELQASKPKIEILKSKSPDIQTSGTSVVNNRKDLPNSKHDNSIIRGIVI